MVYRPWSLEGQRIEVKSLVDGVPTMDVGLAWRRGTNLTPSAAALRDHLHLSLAGSLPSYLS